MTSKGGVAGSASECVVSLARSGTKRMTCPSELSGWSISLQILFRVRREGRHVSPLQEFEAEGVSTRRKCSWQEFAFLSHRRSSTCDVSLETWSIVACVFNRIQNKAAEGAALLLWRSVARKEYKGERRRRRSGSTRTAKKKLHASKRR